MLSELPEFVTLLKSMNDSGGSIVMYLAMGAYLSHILHKNFTSKECLDHANQISNLSKHLETVVLENIREKVIWAIKAYAKINALLQQSMKQPCSQEETLKMMQDALK